MEDIFGGSGLVFIKSRLRIPCLLKTWKFISGTWFGNVFTLIRSIGVTVIEGAGPEVFLGGALVDELDVLGHGPSAVVTIVVIINLVNIPVFC